MRRPRAADYDDAGRLLRSDTKSGPVTGTLASRIDTTYLGDGQPAQTKYSTGSGPTEIDKLDYVYDTSGRPTKVMDGATVLAERAFNADDTIDWRKDGDNAALGQSDFEYDWAKRLTSVNLPDATFDTSETVTRVATGGTNTDSIVLPEGDRVGSTA